jgi:predicted NACHT family NTPase
MGTTRSDAKLSGQVEALTQALRKLRETAGQPSLRTLSQRAGTISHATVAAVFSGRHFPRWQVVEVLVRSMGGDEEAFRQMWIEARKELSEASKSDDDKFLDFYRKAVERVYGRLDTPYLDRSQRGPVDDLYIQPTIKARVSDSIKSPEVADIYDLGDPVQRAVLLGGPGTGKTTACQALTLASATDTSRPVAFHIKLRDWNGGSSAPPRSVVGRIEEMLESFYQRPAPSGLVQRLLDSGRALVIFDGLDELVDDAHRSEVASIIELFSVEYPGSRVIVTSRPTGYARGRLDPTLFEEYDLCELNDSQVESFVRQWFNLRAHDSEAEPAHLADAFLRENSQASDLVKNPLILTLMCSMYKAEGYITRHRSELYEHVFRQHTGQWDRVRGVGSRLHVESLVNRTVAYIAYWLKQRERENEVVTGRELLGAATRFLVNSGHDDAETAAQEVVEYCRDRAGIFTEVGTSSNGDRLYQFAHRTLMEYGAALHLVRSCSTSEELASALIPRIVENKWISISEIAVQLEDERREDGATRFARELLNGIETRSNDARKNLLTFLTRNIDVTAIAPADVKIIAHIAERYGVTRTAHA